MSPPSSVTSEAVVVERVEKRPSLWVKLRAISTPAFFMSPATILVLLFFIIPVFLTIWISTTDMSVATFGNIKMVGLANYTRILRSRWTTKILGNTFFYITITLAFFNVGLALLLALLTSHIDRRAGFFFRTLWLLPRVTPSVIYIIMWKWIAADAPYGIANQFLAPLGITPQNWVSAAPWLMIAVVNGCVGASFGMIIFSSAIEAIPKDYTRAARVDGASTLQTIRYVTLPMIKWPLLFVTTYQTLSLLASFEYIMLLTDGGPGFYATEVWSLHAYHRALANYWGNIKFGFGAAMAAVLVVIGAIASVVYLRVFRFGELVAEPKIEAL